MSSLIFGYAQARQRDIELQLKLRHTHTTPSVRDRLGRVLIALGEQLVAEPAVPSGSTSSVRPAA